MSSTPTDLLLIQLKDLVSDNWRDWWSLGLSLFVVIVVNHQLCMDDVNTTFLCQQRNLMSLLLYIQIFLPRSYNSNYMHSSLIVKSMLGHLASCWCNYCPLTKIPVRQQSLQLDGHNIHWLLAPRIFANACADMSTIVNIGSVTCQHETFWWWHL